MKLNLEDNPMVRRVQHGKSRGGQIVEYRAYYESDAINDGLEYVYWKNFDTSKNYDVPQYIMSDDWIVFPIISIFHAKTFTVLRSPFGNFILPIKKNTETKIIFLPENRTVVLDNASKCNANEKALKTTIAVMSAHGMSKSEIIGSLCADTRNLNNKKAILIKKFLGTEECALMIREEVRQVLARVGLTEETVIQNLVKAYDLAEKKQDVSNMNRSVETMIDLFGLTDKETIKQTKNLELTTETTDLEKLESVKDSVKLTQIDQK